MFAARCALGILLVFIAAVTGHIVSKGKKEFDRKFNLRQETVEEKVTTNIQQGTTEYAGISYSSDIPAVLYEDFNKGVKLLVNNAESECYVQPLNRSMDVGPQAVEEYLATHPDSEDLEVEIEVLLEKGQEILDLSFLGERPSDLCVDKDVFWVETVGQTTARDVMRQKRFICGGFCIGLIAAVVKVAVGGAVGAGVTYGIQKAISNGNQGSGSEA